MGSRGSKGQRGNSHHDEEKGNKGGNGHQSDQHRNHHSDQELDFSDRSRGVVVQTHNGDDSIIGTRRSDIILSGSGDDTVTGGGGHDLLFGGSGIDTAVFSGSVLDYSFAQVGCGPWYVVSGPDGCDFLHRFEVLQFDDAVFTIGSNNAPLAQLRGDAPVGSEDGSFEFAIDLYDLDGGTVSVVSASVTGGATVSVAEGDAQQDAATGSSSGLIVTVDPGAAFAFLGAGETATETVTLVVSDGQGGTTTLTYEVTIEGSNDAPVATAVVATADEDGPAIDIAAAYSDVDATDTHTVTIDTTGALGSVTDNGDGTFSYDANGAFEALAAGETATDTFTFTVDDGNGGVDTETVTVTIQGANDAPVVAAVSGSTSEDGPAILLSADYSDVDSSDSHTITVDTTGTLGSVTNNGDGTFSYDANGAFEALAVGETATDTFTYTVDDGNGGTSTETVTVTITGANDAPEAEAVSGSVTQSGGPITLAAAYTDVDGSDTHTVTIDTTGTSGVVTDNGDGTFSYDPAHRWDPLGLGETATDIFTYTVDDGNGGTSTETVTVTITGENDDPVAFALSGSVSENGPATTFEAGYADLDGNDIHTFTVDTTGTLGAVTNNGDGTFSYDANGAFEALAVGETATDTFTYTVDDGNGGTATETVTVTITGANDAPEAEAVSGSVTQSGGPITLAAAYTDVDGNDTHTVTIDTTGTSGVVTDNGDGTFSYDPAHRWDPLGLGETATDTFTYIVDDGNGGTSTETVTVTITGENDAPVAFALSGSVSEDGPAATFEAGYADLDGNDSHTFTVDTTGTLGSVTNNGDGTFSYDANGAFEHLGCGETATDTFTYTVDDGNGGTATETVTVTITGTNDAPEVSGPISIAASEDDVALLAVDLLANASDAEGDTLGVRNLEVTSDGGLGIVPQVNSDGLLTLDPSAFEALAVGETAEITVSYDVIEADRAYSGSADEPAGGLTNAGTFYVSDSDTGVMYEVERTSAVATQEAALARLAAAGTPVTNGVILLIDENGATRGVATGSRLITDGALSLADPVVTLEGYTGDIFVDDLSTPPRYVSFLDSFSNGTLTVEVEAPDAGCGSLTHVFTFNDISQDSSNQVTFSGMTLDVSPEAVATTATLTVTGTNDAPEVEAVIGTVDEDGGAITLSAAYTDADTNDIHTITLDTSGTLGAVTDNGDGTFDYDPNGAFEALAQGETATDTFTYTVDDGQGGSATETVTVTINGENDAPIAEALSATVAEAGQGSQFSGYVGGALAGNAGIYYVFDLDTGRLSSLHRTSADINSVGNAHLSDGNGVLFHVNPNSSGWVVEAYTFDDGDSSGISPSRYTVFDTDGGGGSSRNGNFLEFPDSNENVQSIRLQLDDLTLSDGRSFDVEMVAGPFDYEVNTTDDVSIGSVRFRAQENLDSPEVTITADVSDVDGDTFVFSVNDTATRGSVINNGDGTFTYSSDGAFEYLDAGQTARDRFYYTVTDEFGATDTELVTITITGEDEFIG